MLEDETGYASTNGHGDRLRHHQIAVGAGTMRARNPIRQVKQHAGNEAGLEYADEEPDDVEAPRSDHEHRCGGGQSPGDQNTGKPDPRAEARHQKIAWNFTGDISEIENRISQTE